MAIPLHASRVVFPPEVDTASMQLALRRVWPPETPGRPLDTVLRQHTTQGIAVQARRNGPMSKPSGEVNEISKGGYSLQSILNWEKKRYKDVQVRHPTL